MSFHAGQIVRDTTDGLLMVVIEDRGPRVLVSELSCLKPDATLVERAQTALPAADFAAVDVQETLKAHGFEAANLGGNCAGYLKRIGNGTVTVLDGTGEPVLPTAWPVYVAFDLDTGDNSAEVDGVTEEMFAAMDLAAELANIGGAP